MESSLGPNSDKHNDDVDSGFCKRRHARHDIGIGWLRDSDGSYRRTTSERPTQVRHEQPFAKLMGSSIASSAGAETSESRAKAAQAVKFIAQMDLPKASRAANAALQLDGRDSYLHFLNGFVYHLQARQGDSQKSELAIEGYRTALRLDPGNWIAQEFLGLAYLDLKQFKQAKEHFAQVLLMAPDTVAFMHGLMVTSYLTGDPSMACAMADRLRDDSSGLDPVFVRSSVAVYASCGKFADADLMRAELHRLDIDRAVIDRTEKRLAQWKDFYRPAAAFTITTRQQEKPIELQSPAFEQQPQFSAPPAASEVPPISAGALPVAAAATGDGTPGMVLVDVVIVSTQESISTSRGVNLLNALTHNLAPRRRQPIPGPTTAHPSVARPSPRQ